jgi:hypothetical protein
MSGTGISIIDAVADEALFQPWFKHPETWRSWFTFLRVLFGLEVLALFRECTNRDAPAAGGYRVAWLVVGRARGLREGLPGPGQPRPGPEGVPAAHGQDSVEGSMTTGEDVGLEGVLAEARLLLTDREVTKSNSSRALALLLVRALEAIVHGKAQTPHPSRHHGADDGLGL